MKLQELLEKKSANVSKEWKVDTKSVAQGIDLLNKYCRNGLTAIKKEWLLYRGFGNLNADKNPMLVIDSSKSERSSRDGYGGYHLIMDASEHFAGWPSRSNSFICSSEEDDADGFGDVYVLFPFDGTQVVSSASQDFLKDGVSNSFFDMQNEDLDVSVHNFLKKLGFNKNRLYPSQAPEINAAIRKHPPKDVMLYLCMRLI